MIKSKAIHNTEEDVCRVTPEQAIIKSRKIKDLKILLNLKVLNGKYVEDSRNFPKAKRILTLV